MDHDEKQNHIRRNGTNHGLDLGLTISRMLAQAHGGNVELMETSPQGTSFHVTLSNQVQPN